LNGIIAVSYLLAAPCRWALRMVRVKQLFFKVF
jgi:hypothetical protein